MRQRTHTRTQIWMGWDWNGIEASGVLCVATQRHCPIELAVSMLIYIALFKM